MIRLPQFFRRLLAHGEDARAGTYRDWVAWYASLGLHLLLLIGLATASIVLPGKLDDLTLSYELPELLEEEPLPQEFLSSEEPMNEIGALSQAGFDSARAAAEVVDEQSLVIFAPEEITDMGEYRTLEIDTPVFQGPEFSDSLPVQGAGSVGTTGALGAIDRITHEIMTSVELQPTLVVWLFDQSGSLRDEREKILKRFRDIYDQLGVIEASNNPAFRKNKDKPLLTAVVGFGEVPHMLTDEPTDDIDAILEAVEAIEDDNSGRENVFQAIAKSADKFRTYRRARHGSRNVMLVVFTDESGDDVDQLDATVELCRNLAMPVYVVGRPAPFGRKNAYVKWIDPDPKFDQRPQWVPVNLGPETLMPERLKLHFLGAGNDDQLLDSGYGPYALTRLCYETGGLYFSSHPNRKVGKNVSRRETDNLAAHISTFFDPQVMRRYQPDYLSVQEYRKRLQTNRARGALVAAAQLSWTSPLEDIRRRFPKRDEAQLATSLSVAQRTAAFRQPKLDRLCQTLQAGEADRDKLKSSRWQVGYDLAMGRALAAKVRNDGYNAMLAKAKQGMAFAEEKNNTWILSTDKEFANSSLERLADKAEFYLRRILEDHADTPWAKLAERELLNPLGWRWKEGYTFIPPLVDRNNNGNARRPEPPRRPTGPKRRNPPPL
ncbi:MAG: VWA domain-containing protein [Planctomycetes bacterium]|nr:VWA domain-containing protein [Planctomycetota bacterium]